MGYAKTTAYRYYMEEKITFAKRAQKLLPKTVRKVAAEEENDRNKIVDEDVNEEMIENEDVDDGMEENADQFQEPKSFLACCATVNKLPLLSQNRIFLL